MRRTITLFVNISGESAGSDYFLLNVPFICRIQEYMEEEMNKKITEKLEENLVVVENIRRARELEK